MRSERCIQVLGYVEEVRSLVYRCHSDNICLIEKVVPPVVLQIGRMSLAVGPWINLRVYRRHNASCFQ